VPINDVFVDEESCGFPVELHVTGFAVRIQWVDKHGNVASLRRSPRSR
jgi:hypothetical protein